MFPSHVMGTFGTNRIYSVGRMVKVADRMRWGFAPSRVGSIPSVTQMQNSSQFQPRGEFAWEHLPVHVVQESKPGMVIRTAESDRPWVKDPHEQDPVSRTRDLHGAIGCDYAVTPQKETSPRGLNLR